MNFYLHFKDQLNIVVPFYEQPELLIGINLDDEDTVEKILRKDDSIFDLFRHLINERQMLNLLKRYSLWDLESILNSYDGVYCYGCIENGISCKLEDAEKIINDCLDVLNCHYSNNGQRFNAQSIFNFMQKIVEKKKIAQLKKDLTKKRRTDFDKNRDALLLMMIEKDGLKCKTCFSIDNITIDHIIPLSKGGTDALENLQLLCRSCNSRKGDR